MAGAEDEVRCNDFNDLERYKTDRRCMHCKIRTFEDMMTCTKCLEFCYCSIQCLEKDREVHKAECDFIGLRKGRLDFIDSKKLQFVRQRAKLLDEDGDPIERNSHSKHVDDVKCPGYQKDGNKLASKHGPKHKKNKKKKKNRRKGATATKSVSQPQHLLSSISKGSFGGSVKIDNRVMTGARFGEGWWKPNKQNIGGSVKVHDSRKTFFLRKATKSSYPEYDTDADSDDGLKLVDKIIADGTKMQNLFCYNEPTGNTNIEKAHDGVKVGMVSCTNQIQSDVGARSAVSSSEPASGVKETPTPCATDPKRRHKSTSDSQNFRDADYQPTGDELVPYDKKKAEEAIGAARGRGSRTPRVLEKCHFCGRESHTMLKCSRCVEGKYCNKICQKKDFPKHKESCRRVGRFLAAFDNVPELLFTTSLLGLGIPPISALLDDLPWGYQYLLFGPRHSILLEIVDFQLLSHHVNNINCSVRARDRNGVTIHIIFRDPSEIYFHNPCGLVHLGSPIPLQLCLQPGNFIILLKPWRQEVCLDGIFTSGIEIHNLKEVYFIFMESLLGTAKNRHS